MKALAISDRADASLSQIFGWTIDKFGQRQADAYSAMLLDRSKAIAAGQVPHQSCRVMFADDLREDLRFARAGQHLVIFIETVDQVLIVDFMHQSADIAGRLG